MFNLVKGFTREDLAFVAEEIDVIVPPRTTIAGLKKLITDSHEYKENPDFVQDLLTTAIAERKLKAERQAEKERFQQEFDKAKLEQEFEKAKLELELEKAKMYHELEMAKIQAENRGHSDFGQAAYRQQYAYAPPMQSVPSNSGHDMSKQLAAAQPGMFPSSGGMASTVQQHHQPQIGGPVPSQQQALMVQPGQQQISAMQINSYYQRPNVQRSMANVAKNPLTPVVNQTGQQPEYSQIQFGQSTPFLGIHNTMPPIMVNQFPKVYQQRQFQQYPIQPTVFVNNWNGYNNAPQPNANGYFPIHGMPAYNAMAPQQQQPPVTSLPSQHRSVALPIIDPSAGKNMLDSRNDENNSSPPLEKDTADVLKHEASSGLEESIGNSKVHRVHNVESVKETECTKTVSEEMQPAIVPIVVKEETKVPESPEIDEAITLDGSSSKTSDKSIKSKKNKAKKKKDYNKKVLCEEGWEMNAFLDNKVENRKISGMEKQSSTVTDLAISPRADCKDNEKTSKKAENKIVLKYSYNENQWSSLNPEGKRKYDRDFLIQLQTHPMALCRPCNLPKLDIIKDKAHVQRLTVVNRTIQQAPVSQIRTSKDPFVPIYARGAARLPDDVEGIRLGPGGRGLSSWGRGSYGGTEATDNDVKTALTNKYSLSFLADPVPTQSYEGRRGSQRSAATSRESSQEHNSPLPPSIRKTPSIFKERVILREFVKRLTRVHDSKPQDIKKKAEVHFNGISADSEELILRGPEYSEDEMEKKTKPLVDEFLHNNDFDEAVKCVMELASPSTVHMFINFAINQVLERSSQSRHMLGQLLCSLTMKKVISLDQYKKGFRDVLEMLDEFALDIPLIWEYMGEILAPLVEVNEFPLTFLKDVLQPCMPSESAGLLVSAILHSAGKRKGSIKLGEVWRESGLQWSDFLGNGSNVNEFIQKHKLEFTMSPTQIKPKTQMSMEEIQSNLLTLLKKSDENEEIFDWIDANVSENTEPKFIRALVTAVHKDVIMVTDSSYKLDKAKLKKRTTLLTRYIDHDETLQLQALYAMQALMNQLEHPSGLLHQIFDILYDDDVITEDAFMQWKQSDDPNEVEGKGVAMHSSKSFFTWLRESESGDDDANE